MKKLLSTLALALVSIATLPVQAQVTGNFDVMVTLTSACEITTAPSNLAVSYTSFQTTAAFDTKPFAVRCTNTLPYTMSLSAPTGPLVGLTYTLAIRNSADSADVIGSINGTGSAVDYNIRATVAANQAGTCAIGSCNATDAARTLTITY